MIKILGIIGVALLLGGGVAAAIVMGIIPLPFGPAAEATSKYLKVALTLEFIDSKLKDPPKGAAVLVQQTEFAAEMSPYSQIIDDALVTTLSGRSSADLIKLD